MSPTPDVAYAPNARHSLSWFCRGLAGRKASEDRLAPVVEDEPTAGGDTVMVNHHDCGTSGGIDHGRPCSRRDATRD